MPESTAIPQAQMRKSAAMRPDDTSRVTPPPCPEIAPSRVPAAAPTSWADLKSAIRASGRFDRAIIMRIALVRARAERDAFDRMALPQPWSRLLAHELLLVWQAAKTAMDGLIAERIRVRLAPAERAARTLELRAALLAGAIPPRPAQAAGLHAQAAARRKQGDA